MPLLPAYTELAVVPGQAKVTVPLLPSDCCDAAAGASAENRATYPEWPSGPYCASLGDLLGW